jgi:hypothetical protein
MKRFVLGFVALIGLCGGQADAALITVKEFAPHPRSTGIDNENTVAAVSGTTFGGQVTSSADLAGADIVIAGSYNASLLKSWVAGGGILIIHDWGHIANSLPGLSGAAQAAFNNTDINVVDASHPIVNGPFGTITDSLLDGGLFSIHGAWLESTLDTSSDPLAGPVRSILSSSSATSIGVFEYSYGSGHIIYANIPLEAYTDSDPLVVRTQPAGLRVYAQNELAYAASLSATPEPASMTLLGIGGAFGLLGYRLRHRKAEATPTAAA